ncbi:GTP pyrophosphokinase [Aromatoleum toluvorans]|uniref:GTP pyrophosphokinase n=1 Tax=Aromatoleum toluvorans TaxID=92002 RepID=A0ABX1PWK2_9RHOO|nr:GTP pyrophosphokinase [Aromatoleum toluvorans]NMG43819.1 GTP pyrophosphokinase [Aromatoleum toluvorans]
MNTEQWLDETLPRHARLTQAVVTIIENLLKSREIDYLTITGRTKDKQGALEKIKRKGYKDPAKQLTDLSGIRIIVFFESDIQAVSELVTASFCVDKENSLNKDRLLSTDQIGYRSVHFVCDLGDQRGTLPEFHGLSGLKFEFQVRTVLQHAWAELAHDRNYKFSGKLPREIERKLYLYAGMLEIADKGFDEISTQIDDYIRSLQQRSAEGDLSAEIDSISLAQFIEDWSRENDFPLDEAFFKDKYGELVEELKQFGVTTLFDLKEIIPNGYQKISKQVGHSTTAYGLIRNWMLITDWRRFLREVTFNWVMSEPEIFRAYFDVNEFSEFAKSFEWEIESNEVSDEDDFDITN